ncbi:hypothetical protein KOW79_016501, partial [Hemibagrus wyckioides]
DPGRVDPPEDYDDAVTAGPIPDHVDEDEAENYDDAITADQKSVILTGHTEARLVNGPDSCSGRVELQYLGEWGTVCAVGWDMRAADVLCAQLDCGSAVAVVEVDWFGNGSGHIWADVFDCQGKETHLSRCGVSSWSRAACSHKHDAGVICNGSSMVFHEGRVRLSGGRECQGEVEIYFRQHWRRVLLDSWSLSEASVLCRQLGCGSVLNYRSSPSTTEHKHMCVTGFSCSGSEAHLGNCSRPQAEPVNCSSGEQLYITCSGPRSIRLVGSGGDCAGRLEVFHSGSWGTVCDDSWDIEDAQVVCRQLQCGVALSTHIPAWFGPGTGSIWLNEVKCEGNETSLWNCRFQLCEEGECGHHEDVGVVCSEFKEIRLSEGCEGNLEVFYNGTWGNVCYNQMDDETVNMVCRELNCGRRGSLSNTEARVKSAPNWLDELKCRKHDSNLWQCPSSPWGQNRCDNREEAARITCTDISTMSTATPTTTSTTSTTTTKSGISSSVFLTSVSPPTPPLVLFVLGTLLFLALVLLLVLFYQNRVLRRVVSRTRRKTESEAVYEEINHRYMARRITSFTQRGSLLSEEQHSGYEDVDDELLSVKSGMGEKAEYYDDVIDTSDIISDPGRVDPPEDYDDAVTAGPIPDHVDEDEAENYDDAITADQKSVILTEDVSENYDDAVTTETNPNIITEFKEIRLSEGCEGNLEVFYNGTWGNVCYNQMDDETIDIPTGATEVSDTQYEARGGSANQNKVEGKQKLRPKEGGGASTPAKLGDGAMFSVEQSGEVTFPEGEDGEIILLTVHRGQATYSVC